MNLEELQTLWKELDEKIQQQELLRQEEIKRILTTRKESTLEKLIRIERTGLIFLIACAVFFSIAWTQNPYFGMLNGVLVSLFLLTGIVFQFRFCWMLQDIEQEKNLERQLIEIVRYKRNTNLSYLIGYAGVFAFIVLFMIQFGSLKAVMILTGITGVALTVDFYLYHYIRDKVKNFIQASKELSQFNL